MKHRRTAADEIKGAFQFLLLTLGVTGLVLIFVGCWFDIEPEIAAFVDSILGGF